MRSKAAKTVTFVVLAAVLARLVLDVVLLVCRTFVWLLLRLCWALEWAIARLTDRPTVRPNDVPVSRVQRVSKLAPPSDDITRLMKVLGTRDRGEAERLMALGTKVKPN